MILHPILFSSVSHWSRLEAHDSQSSIGLASPLGEKETNLRSSIVLFDIIRIQQYRGHCQALGACFFPPKVDNPKHIHMLRPTNTSRQSLNIRNFTKTPFSHYFLFLSHYILTIILEWYSQVTKKYSQPLSKRNSTHTLDWYVKWIASVVLLCAFSVRGIPEYALYDQILSLTGLILWFWVSLIWNDRALMILNGVGIVLVLRNLIQGLGSV